MARGRARLVGVATGYGAAAVAMPVAALPGSPSAWAVWRALVAATVAAAVALATATAGRRARGWAIAGPPIALAAAVLLDVTAPGLITVLLGALAGAAVGVSAPQPWRSLPAVAAGAVAGVATVVALRLAVGTRAALVAAVLATVVSALATLATLATGPARRRRPNGHGHGWLVPAGALVAAVGLLAWSGANDPELTWFGPTISRGPAAGNRVALTFDDGPNETATLAVRDVLDRYDVKATFFLVGTALDTRPDIARALLADGMLLGGHSYHHDDWRWLDPRYPELQRVVDSFESRLGVCPRYYRPPHGQRTPFVSLLLSRRDMKMVTWNVSAGDWATDDPRLVAARVLDAVEPGSVILLHDGLDGHVDVDRRVIVEALPLILDGLRQRGLQPVRLDELVGQPAYIDSC